MKPRISLIIILLTAVISINGQEIPSFLKQVEANNPEIEAYRKLLEARRLETRTGIAPPDPVVTLGYMPETTERGGSKKTWSVTQSFSFPTKYLIQKKLGREKITLAEQEFNLAKLDILLNAKILLFDLIYNRKTLNILNQRKLLYDRLKSGWEKMLEAGETTILDYNKILLEFSSLNLSITRAETEISILGERLHYMTGNKADPPANADYPIPPDTDPEKLISEKSRIHPSFILPESEYLISLQEARLSKSGSLPEFQAGYASEIVPGETFTGPVAGLSIPLWSNTKRVKTANAMVDHYAAARDARLLELKSLVQSEYENMIALRKSISEIRDIVESNGNQYLEKALSGGEISLTDYFLYLETSFRAEDRLNELENEYYKSMAVLCDHELLE